MPVCRTYRGSHIVGYGQNDLRQQFTGVGPTFFAIGEDVTSIQDLKVVGLGVSQGSGYTISPLTQGGNIPTSYFWWCGLTDYGVKDGWYITDDGEVIEQAAEAGEEELEKYLAPLNMAKGDGLITIMGKAGLKLQGAGEVLTGDQTIPLRQQFTGVANPFPVEVDLQSFAVVGLGVSQGSGYTISPLTQGGNIPTSYFWWCGLSAYGVKDGWYITDDGEVIEQAAEAGEEELAKYRADYTVKPGEALITIMGKAGLQLKITSPIADAAE